MPLEEHLAPVIIQFIEGLGQRSASLLSFLSLKPLGKMRATFILLFAYLTSCMPSSGITGKIGSRPLMPKELTRVGHRKKRNSKVQ